MNTPSLARRITVAVVAITGSAVLLAALAIWLDTRHILLAGVDRELDRIVDHLRLRDREPLPEPTQPRLVTPLNNDRHRLIQVLDTATGLELFRSPGLSTGESLAFPENPGHPFPPHPPPPDDGPEGPPPEWHGSHPAEHPRTVRLADGRWVRLCVLVQQQLPSFLPPEVTFPRPGSVTVLVGLDLRPIEDELRRMALMLAGCWITATALAWIAVAALLKTILRPIHRLAESIGRLGPDDLTTRVTDEGSPKEVGGIVLRVNDLMDRLEQAFRREQATISNIAHELRTPVTVLRTTIEFRLLATSCSTEEAGVLKTCLETTRRMQSQVMNLLLLARLEAGKEPLEREDVDLALLLDEAVEPWLARSVARGQTVTVHAPANAPVHTAAGHVLHVLDNLMGNAVNHAPAGSVISVDLTVEPKAIHVRIRNPCLDGIDPSRLGRAFYRGDAARRSSEHNGLGLALCSRLSDLLGGRLELDTGHGWFTATWHLPR